MSDRVYASASRANEAIEATAREAASDAVNLFEKDVSTRILLRDSHAMQPRKDLWCVFAYYGDSYQLLASSPKVICGVGAMPIHFC